MCSLLVQLFVILSEECCLFQIRRLWFLRRVLTCLQRKVKNYVCRLVLLSGQIADGIATPIVGYFSDKINTRIGKRTPWYIFGTILVTICFLFLFQECLLCEWFGSNDSGLMMFYYIFFPSVFNVGWAAVQVAHMSLVPSLTLSRKQRDSLNTLRNNKLSLRTFFDRYGESLTLGFYFCYFPPRGLQNPFFLIPLPYTLIVI